MDNSEVVYDMVLVDFPGTVNVAGVFQSIVNMDYLFVPVTQNRMVMQSSLNFALAIRELITHNDELPLRDVRIFWNCMDKRVSRELYNTYMEILKRLDLSVFETVLPRLERFNKGIGKDGLIFRSTLFPPSSNLLKGSSLDLFAIEVEKYLFSKL